MQNFSYSNKIPLSLDKKSASFFKPVIQPKLTTNQPDDVYEQEANAVADKVMRMSDGEADHFSFFKPAVTSIQQKCAHCQEEEEKIRRKETGAATAITPSTENYIRSLSGGMPLAKSEQSFFKSRMGYDFSNVRLHTDSAANRSAKSIDAVAYTSGENIVFGAGAYAPQTEAGKKLLAHELTHVVQQKSVHSDKPVQRQLYPPLPIVIRPSSSCPRRLLNGTTSPNTGITVSWNGNQIAIQARMQFSGPGATAQVADAIKRDIERVWNATFPDGYASSCRVDVLVGGATDATRAQVIVGIGGSVDQSSVTGSTMYFMYSGSPGDLVWSPAHEFTHLLGLADRRTRPWWDIFETQPETSEPGYERNIVGAIPGGDYSRRSELRLESRNIRDWLNQYAVEYVDCAQANTA